MRMSQYFLPTMKENPAEAQIVSHRLMLRAGLVRQTSAGIYAWLPLGFRVLKNIERIVREEQDRSGAQEVLMPTIQSADLWRESGRYDAYGPEMLRIKDRHDREMLFGPTNEEVITVLFRDGVKSYRDLPRNLYHIQWKFRDEVRPRFGVMRGREFLMKDNYSFDIDKKGAIHSYNKMFVTYLRTFARMGLKAIPMRAETGPIGGDLSHEFIVLADTGESAVFCHKGLVDKDILSRKIDYDSDLQPIVNEWTSLYAATDDMHDKAAFEKIPEGERLSARGIEVGHIFYFGTKYSAPMKAVVAGPGGEQITVEMGSYGIGVSRLVGGIIEASHDEAGIVWPESVAPFKVAIVNLKPDDGAVSGACQKLYDGLAAKGIEVLHDDRDLRPGAQVRRHGPDRPALAGDRRAQGRVGRQGRGQGPQDRQARGSAVRPGRPALRLRPMAFAAVERLIAFRYLRARREEGFISVIAAFSLIGITLGRRHADRRHVGHERLSLRDAAPDVEHQRPARRAGQPRRPRRHARAAGRHEEGARRAERHADGRGPGHGRGRRQGEGRGAARRAARRLQGAHAALGRDRRARRAARPLSQPVPRPRTTSRSTGDR